MIKNNLCENNSTKEGEGNEAIGAKFCIPLKLN